MSSTEDKYLPKELEEKEYEFSGHPLKITTFEAAYLGVSAFVWEPGLILCRYFEDEKINFTGKKVLELGSGTGIVGILAVLLGGDVTMTDRPHVLKQIEYNVSANIPGLILCRYFEDENINFTGKKVLELGSGTGIVGILAVLLGGDVTMTDRPHILKQIEYNVSANIPVSSRHRSQICALTWGNDQENFPADYDFILGSDIVYNPSQFPSLLQTLMHLCNENTTIYLSSDVKYREGAAKFHNELVPEQFNSKLIHTSGNNCIYNVTRKVPGDEH